VIDITVFVGIDVEIVDDGYRCRCGCAKSKNKDRVVAVEGNVRHSEVTVWPSPRVRIVTSLGLGFMSSGRRDASEFNVVQVCTPQYSSTTYDRRVLSL
jgi:hypothetical protein